MLRRAALTSMRRTSLAFAFALLLALRMLSPTGFMPDWSGSGFRIALCDDAGAQIAAAAHHSHGKTDKAKHRQSCPYAAASANQLHAPPVLAAVIAPKADPLERSGAESAEILPRRKIERPPSRAPPILA